MFPDKADVFLRKWEPSIVPKLLKLAALENKEDSPEDESDGKVEYRPGQKNDSVLKSSGHVKYY